MRIAAIDIGTNTVLLLVAERVGGVLVPILDRSTVTRLGEGVDRNRRLLPNACARTLACLADYARTLRELGVSHLDAVGTSALRDAAGGVELMRRAQSLLGIVPRVIDGQEEARLTFRGALSGLHVTGKLAVFDIGGGSTEVVIGENDARGARITSAISLDVGSVRLFERHVRSDPPSGNDLQCIERDIAQALSRAPDAEPSGSLIGVAGTITQLAALELEREPHARTAACDGGKLTRSAVEYWADRLATLSLAERRALPGMNPERADVLATGSVIARAVLRWSGKESLIATDRGVRWGLAEELAETLADS